MAFCILYAFCMIVALVCVRQARACISFYSGWAFGALGKIGIFCSHEELLMKF